MNSELESVTRINNISHFVKTTVWIDYVYEKKWNGIIMQIKLL